MTKNKEQNNLRYERKFFISELSRFEIEAIVKSHPLMFSEIYHQRNVNNIYFDSFDLANFFENIDGQSQRVKFRIRWYGELLGVVEKPVLEIKSKRGQLGGKIHFPLDPFCLDEHLTNDRMREIIINAKIPNELKLIMEGLNYTLLNSYTRTYYQSKDENYRITIDSDMRFVHLSHLYNSFLNELNDHVHSILELKYERELDDSASMITNHFPFRMTKSSKYVTGIERLGCSLI